MSPLASAHRWLAHRVFVVSLLATQIGRAGAVALVTAICAPMLVMIVGFIVDFSYASYINQRLARATDDATVGSVSQTAATAGGGYGNLAFLQTTGVKYFNANTAQLGATGVTFSLSVVSDGTGGVTATGTYTYNVPTFFAGILGIDNIPVSGSARTTARPLTYVNYYILIDASQSMGIAATQADMNRMYSAVSSSVNGPNGCVFGCHVKAAGQQTTNEAIAHGASPPIQLRIDAAVQAVQSIIAQAQAIAGTSKNIKFALYTMQEDPTWPLASTIQTISTMSNDYAALLTAAGTIDLGNNLSSGRGDTDFATEFLTFSTVTTLGALPGSGASATSPVNYFFIITDGVSDTYGLCNGTYQHCTGPINPLICTALKLKGTVGVIYTIYSPIWANNNPSGGVLDSSYSDLVSGFSAQIEPSLQGCATSSKYFFKANFGPEIVTQTQLLFQSTQMTSARLTQ